MSVLLWSGVFLLGGAGSVLRFLVSSAVTARARSGYPFGTLAVNLSGSFALGVVSARGLGHDATLLVATATIGAYTTFSTWKLDTVVLRERPALRVVNVVGSVVAGVALVALGRAL